MKILLILLIGYIFIMIILIVLQIKNNQTKKVRIKILYSDISKYDLLPKYRSMWLHLHLWTYSQWDKWLIKKGG